MKMELMLRRADNATSWWNLKLTKFPFTKHSVKNDNLIEWHFCKTVDDIRVICKVDKWSVCEMTKCHLMKWQNATWWNDKMPLDEMKEMTCWLNKSWWNDHLIK